MGTRYVGLIRETNFGDEDIKTNGIIYSEFAESTLDVANDTAIEFKKGLGRSTRQIDQGPYVPQGDISGAVTSAFMPYVAYGIGGKYQYIAGADKNKHVFWNTDGRVAPSYQVHVGKDIVEHVFLGATFSSFSISCDKEYAEFTASMVCKKDVVNGEAMNEEQVAINALDETPIPFSMVSVKIDGVKYTDRKVLNSLSISIENNASADDGIGLGSIYTHAIELGETTSSVDFESLFDDDTFLTMFKQGKTHTIELTFEDKNGDTVVIYFPAVYLSRSEQTASGRDIMRQPLTFKAMAGTIQVSEDVTLNTEFTITVTNEHAEYTF